MAGNFAETTRWKLRRLLGSSKGSDIDEGFQRLAEDVDTKMVGLLVDTFAKRPAASIVNRLFRASDTGAYYLDTGTEWDHLISTLNVTGYAALVTQATNLASGASTEWAPNATRATIVNIDIAFTVTHAAGGNSGIVKVFVGGKLVAEPYVNEAAVPSGTTASFKANVTVWAQPGEKIKVENVSGNAGKIETVAYSVRAL